MNAKRAANALKRLAPDQRAAYLAWAETHQADGDHFLGIARWNCRDEGHAEIIVNPTPPPPTPAAPKQSAAPAAAKPRATFGPRKEPAAPKSSAGPAEPYPGARADFEAIMCAPVWVTPCSISKSWEAFVANVPTREVFAVVERAMIRLGKYTAADQWRPTLLVFLRDQFRVGSGGDYVPRVVAAAEPKGENAVKDSWERWGRPNPKEGYALETRTGFRWGTPCDDLWHEDGTDLPIYQLGLHEGGTPCDCTPQWIPHALASTTTELRAKLDKRQYDQPGLGLLYPVGGGDPRGVAPYVEQDEV